MYKMVIQAVMLCAAAMFFIFMKSDDLRAASKTSDVSPLVQVPNWSQYDPRRLWQTRSKSIRLNPKTIRVEAQDFGAIWAAKRLNPATISVVRLD